MRSSAKKTEQPAEDDNQTYFIKLWSERFGKLNAQKRALNTAVNLVGTLHTKFLKLQLDYDKVYKARELYDKKCLNSAEYLKEQITNNFLCLLIVTDEVEFLRTGRIVNDYFLKTTDVALVSENKVNYFSSTAQVRGPPVKLNTVSHEGVIYEQKTHLDNFKKAEEKLVVR